uniref:non-specific serine/threonine protein kinase n=1 Tax=Bionectria ochroleuca TaxID=29856 RepID=A0A8H7TWJ8_BIOOC
MKKPLRIEINEKSVPDSLNGITFGSSKHCGVRFPKHEKTSNCHFSLNFDDKGRLVIRNHSTNGLQVTYGEQGAGWRSQSQCILNDPKLPPELRQITINVAGVIIFAVDVRLMLSSEESYTKVVNGFRFLCEKSQDLASNFQRAALHETDQMLSSYQFSDVWLQMIVKAPSSQYDKAKWSRQVEVLKILEEHHHVVDILNPQSTSEGQIEMEYLSGGSLEELRNPSLGSGDSSDLSDARSEYSTEGSDIFEDSYSEFSKEEVTCILAQCLSVLARMHTESPPIYYLDLTRSNILINRRDSSGICVKVAGFGAVTGKPETGKGGYCGYARLDIWSLGLAVLGLINKGVRRLFGTEYRKNWTQMDESEDSLVQFLREHVLQEDLRKTKSAAECLKLLQANGGIQPCVEESSDSLTPRQKKLADGQSEDSANTPMPTRASTPTPTTAQLQAAHVSLTPGGSGTDMPPTTPDVGGSLTTSLFAALLEDSSANAGEQVAAPASPADSSTGAVFTDETHAPIKGKRRAADGDEVLENKRSKV